MCTYALSNHWFIQTYLVWVLYSIAGQRLSEYLNLVSFATFFLINCKNTQDCPTPNSSGWCGTNIDKWCQAIHTEILLCSILCFITYHSTMPLSAFILIIPHLHISFVFHAFVYSTQTCLFLPDDTWMCTVYNTLASTSLFSYTYVGRVLFIVYNRLPTVFWLSYDVPAAESWHQT